MPVWVKQNVGVKERGVWVKQMWENVYYTAIQLSKNTHRTFHAIK